MTRPKVRRVAQPPAVLADCGHWAVNPYQHNESGGKREISLCRSCHELILNRDMRLNLDDPGRTTEE